MTKSLAQHRACALLLGLALLLVPALAHAQGAGILARSSCTANINPIAGQIVCFDQTLNAWMIWTGAQWSQVTVPAFSNTAPTVSGFCTSPTVPANNGTVAFTVNVGTACAGSTGTITLPAAVTAWVCQGQDVTTPASFIIGQTGGTTTTATVTNYSRTTGLATNWTASEVLRFSCVSY